MKEIYQCRLEELPVNQMEKLIELVLQAAADERIRLVNVATDGSTAKIFTDGY